MKELRARFFLLLSLSLLSIDCGDLETGLIDTSAELAAIVTDESGSGALTFGGLANTSIDTSSELAAIVTDEAGSGTLTFGGAASGANSDITSLTGLTTALSVAQGGTGGTTAAGARTNLSAAASGANSDITSLTGLTTALSVAQGGTGSTTAAGALSNLGGIATTDIDTSLELATILTNEMGSGLLVFDTSPTLTTPTIGVATATSIAFGNEALANYDEGTFTPTVTLVGGAGNTVPVYSTNTGRYTRIGNRVFVDVYLTGDGGAEGAGTGVINIALPFTASANHPTGYIPAGHLTSLATTTEIYVQIPASATTFTIAKLAAGSLTDLDGDQQTNATRTIRVKFSYEL